MSLAKKNPPLISVTMATYNRADILPRAVESILNQSFTNFEFIIVDDGSTDETQKVLKDYQNQDNRIVIACQPNSGPATARNYSLQLARGKYIALMDDDDISLPKRLEEQVNFLTNETQSSACVCDNYNILDKQGEKLKKKKRKHSRLPRDKESLKTKLSLPFILGPMTLITKQAFIDSKGYRPTFTSAMDLDLTLRFQERFQAGVIHKFLYQYRTPDVDFGSNLTTKNLIKALNCHIAAYISAWFRRNKGMDPLDKGQFPADLINLANQLPPISRKRIIKTMTPIIKRFKHLSELSINEMQRVIDIINQLNSQSLVKSRFKFRQALSLSKEGRWLDILKLSQL